MPHPIYGPVPTDLERVTVTIVLPCRQNAHLTSMRMEGTMQGKRVPLWSFRETWTPDEIVNGLQCSDLIAHAVLSVLQDRPDSQERVEASLLGEGWEDVPLPF